MINKKRNKLLALALAIMLAIYVLANVFSNENRIDRLVTRNLSFLNECVKSKSYNEIYKLKTIKKITPYTYNKNEAYIDFYCYGFGLVPSSIYYGFYYTSKDEPVGFQAVPVEFRKDGDGWRWEEQGGDNWQYTRKIAEHWYYYKAGF